MTTDPLSLDSYQNILFSLLAFHNHPSTMQTYPTSITIITHAFKRRRFLELHLPALRWPADRVDFIGINPPGTPLAALEQAEQRNGWDLWALDRYGAGGDLSGKRRKRDVWGVQAAGYPEEKIADERVRKLVRWKGPEVFACRVPWESKGCTVAACEICREGS